MLAALLQEYAIAAEAFGLLPRDLLQLAQSSMDYTFAGAPLRAALHRRLDAFEAQLLGNGACASWAEVAQMLHPDGGADMQRLLR